jgi:rRNA processing protein Gar1
MKYLGKVDDIIFNGKIIVRTTFKPRFGDIIVDKHKKTIGKVSQIIGPVKEPYIIISPNKNVKASFKLIGTDIYIK